MAIKVLKPGLATTVQDLGRPGYYHIGIPLSGGMDRHALAAANLLVGNEEGAAVLEAVFMGPELEFTDDALVAITGAELPPKLDGEQEARLTALACSQPPTGYARWTLRLLAERLVELEVVGSIAHETVRRALKKAT